jgi:hypothetical protein
MMKNKKTLTTTYEIMAAQGNPPTEATDSTLNINGNVVTIDNSSTTHIHK